MGRHDSADSNAGCADPWAPRRSGLSVDAAPSLPGYRDFVPVARSEGSEVYRAYQDGVDRPVAVKVLLLDDPEAVARFHRELEITVQLGRQHPHIVTVIDTGTTSDGRPCIVMEHYDHGSLHDRLRARGPLPWDEVLAAGTVVADALSFAHRHGVLHRDVKPQNVLVLPTSYVVADFGIARRIDAARTTSVEWFSFRHAAPQVLDGEPPAVADDIWSVGSTMFTLLDGLPPFAVGNADEDTALAYMKRVRTGRRRALNRHDVPPGLVSIIDGCLQQERADRFPDAAALRAALSDLTAQTRAWAPPETATHAPPPMPPAGAIAPPTGGTVPPVPGTTPPVPGTTPPVPGTTPPVLGTTPPMPGTTPPMPGTTPPMLGTAPPMLGTASYATGSQSYGTAATGRQGVPLPAAAEDATVKGPQPAPSPSALAEVVASQVAAGGYVAGEETIGPGYGEPPSAGPAGPAGSLRRILVGTAVALLIGGVLGIGGTWVAGLTRGDAGKASHGQAGAPGGSPAPASPTPARPSADQSTAASRVNPRIAPVVTVRALDRTTVRVRWQDRSAGRAQFVVIRVSCPDGPTSTCGDPTAVGQPLKERGTELVVDNLDPATAPYCFLVLALAGGENGPSAPDCVDPAE